MFSTTRTFIALGSLLAASSNALVPRWDQNDPKFAALIVLDLFTPSAVGCGGMGGCYTKQTPRVNIYQAAPWNQKLDYCHLSQGDDNQQNTFVRFVKQAGIAPENYETILAKQEKTTPAMVGQVGVPVAHALGKNCTFDGKKSPHGHLTCDGTMTHKPGGIDCIEPTEEMRRNPNYCADEHVGQDKLVPLAYCVW